MNEIEINKESNELDLFSKENFNHYFGIAEKMAKTTMVPKNFINKPMDIVVAMQYGMSLGLGMMQSIQEIAVINGKPALYGDCFLAVCQGSDKFESIQEKTLKDKSGVVIGASCTVKRKDGEPYTKEFTIDMAKKAGLWGRSGPWLQYPERMLQMRARGFALRDQFADVLRGVKSVEEVQDYQIKDITPKNAAQDIITDLTASHIKEISEHVVPINEKVTGAQIEHLNQLFTERNIDDERKAKALPTLRITDAQVEIISGLFAEKELAPERITKALSQFGVDNILKLKKDDADTLISQLNLIG